MTDEPLLIRTISDGVAVLQLNRPEARNALSDALRDELSDAIETADADPEIRVILICGDDANFAAGADIVALSQRDLASTLESGRGRTLWTVLAECRTPLIAGVSGFCLGGGFELALACDMIVASETAEFGTPEITLGIIPGGGGTQRLARVLGKQKAMELVLTGRRVSAHEAKEYGLVNDVTNKHQWFEKARALAEVIARRPPVAVKLGKQAVLAAEETSLTAGLAQERRLFELAMATEDRKEGMTAFIEKRPAKFEGR